MRERDGAYGGPSPDARGGHNGFDLTLGRSGTVLAAALLLDALPAGAERGGLLALGREHLDAVWSWIDGLDDAGQAELTNLGIAHGWAGLLYATLQWHRAAGDALPGGLPDRLDQLARRAEPPARGIAWPWDLDPAHAAAGTMPGWCNGTAGHAALWCLAADVLADARLADRAVAAAWDVWDAPDMAGSLCCGLVGRAYALPRVHRLTGDPAWLRRARVLGERTADVGHFEPEFPLSLYKGRVALVTLAADLEAPAAAAHPFLEEERWPAMAATATRLTLGAARR